MWCIITGVVSSIKSRDVLRTLPNIYDGTFCAYIFKKCSMVNIWHCAKLWLWRSSPLKIFFLNISRNFLNTGYIVFLWILKYKNPRKTYPSKVFVSKRDLFNSAVLTRLPKFYDTVFMNYLVPHYDAKRMK